MVRVLPHSTSRLAGLFCIQGSCNVDLGFPELFLDGRHVASGLQINNVMGTTVGPSCYFLNFTLFGIQINGGHEVLLDRSWLGETNFDYPFSPTDLPTAIAIQGRFGAADVVLFRRFITQSSPSPGGPLASSPPVGAP